MRAILLAAGRGSRMGSMTQDRPKCFTPLKGRPLLEWQLAALSGGGVTEVSLVRGYMPESFTQPLTYFDNPRWAETNMVASLRCAAPWLREAPCLISYSDIVYGARTVASLAQASADLAISYDPDWLKLWSMRFADPLGDAETFRLDGEGRVVAIGGRASRVEEIRGQYMGLLRFTPAGWKQVEDHLDALPASAWQKMDMTSLLAALIARGIGVTGIRIDEPWYEVDSESDLRTYESLGTLFP